MAVLVHRPKALLLTVAVGLMLVVPWYYVAQTLRHVQPVPSVPATSVYWGSLYFNNAAELSRWLHRRGARYRVWARRHPPAAARILNG